MTSAQYHMVFWNFIQAIFLKRLSGNTNETNGCAFFRSDKISWLDFLLFLILNEFLRTNLEILFEAIRWEFVTTLTDLI